MNICYIDVLDVVSPNLSALQTLVIFADVCIGEDLPEVELVSLLTESLPNYRLRADTVTDFTIYRHQDWGINTPLVKASDLQLSNAQIDELFKYFSKCPLLH